MKSSYFILASAIPLFASAAWLSKTEPKLTDATPTATISNDTEKSPELKQLEVKYQRHKTRVEDGEKLKQAVLHLKDEAKNTV